MDSVFIGPNERQNLLLEFTDQEIAPMFLEDALNKTESFAAEERPRHFRESSKINILPQVQALHNLVKAAREPLNMNVLPGGFKAHKVRNSFVT